MPSAAWKYKRVRKSGICHNFAWSIKVSPPCCVVLCIYHNDFLKDSLFWRWHNCNRSSKALLLLLWNRKIGPDYKALSPSLNAVATIFHPHSHFHRMLRVTRIQRTIENRPFVKSVCFFCKNLPILFSASSPHMKNRILVYSFRSFPHFSCYIICQTCDEVIKEDPQPT